MRALFLIAITALALTATACVRMDPKTGDPLPRGDQRFEFEIVKERAKQLQDDMTRLQVLLLLGSPAEKSEDGSVWLYLPERLGILIPAKALRVEFHGDFLKDHGYRPIILGQDL